ncbi:DUF1827 family protein [Loigolactobacillus zhaoyuanensis]|uniref:DUF1827 family protein n=1 Tax=Loigolactobacillus zhaoyuanensis TaxID=2486017 RepID=A0ABW8UDZ5_9LACO|nr:DUF1827 family protein [Loigolactobacillus zhaoyuanensis]
MQLQKVTADYQTLVTSQLNNTDATDVQIFALADTLVIFTQAPTHDEILLTNRQRNIAPEEIDYTLAQLAQRTRAEVNVITSEKLAEISLEHK